MDILILTNFTSTFSESDNDRFIYIAKMLCENNDVEILTSSFCHEKKDHRYTPESQWPFKITFLEEPGYKKNICLKRFYSHFVWGLNVKSYLSKRKRPDVIYCAVPSLTAPYFAASYCKKEGIRFITDIQDLWPEAFQLVFNIPIISDAIFYPFKHIANYIYNSSDDIIAVSKTYLDRATKGNNKYKIGKAVFLGTDLDIFDKNINTSVDLPKKDGLWIAYCGTLGSSYDLMCVFDALKIVKDSQLDCPKFIVMGDGPLKDKFMDYSNELNLDVLYTGRIPYNKMCAILSKCDVAINPISHGAAQSIINKHADYVASGKPIISTQESQEFRSLVADFDMGINTSDNPKELADAIILLINDEKKRIEMGKNARKCAEEKFNRKNTYISITELILNSENN